MMLRLVVIGVVMASIGLTCVSVLPSATITVRAKQDVRVIKKDILLSSTITTPDYIHFILPAHLVSQTATANKTFTQPSTQITQANSVGTVTFTNKQSTEQRLLPKTHLRYEKTGVMFTTNSPVTIPANGTVNAEVTAEGKGTSGDVAPGKFLVDKFSSGLQQVVYAESISQFSGGELGGHALTQSDVDTAKKETLDQATAEAISKLQQQANGVEIKKELLTIETKNHSVSAEVGSKVAVYSSHAEVEAKGFVVDSHDIISLMTLALRAQTSSDEEFASFDPASFTLSISQTDWAKGQARISASLTGTYAKKIGTTELSTNNLAGLSKAELESHFTAIPSIGSIDVTFWPFWVKSTPSRPNQITIKVAQ